MIRLPETENKLTSSNVDTHCNGIPRGHESTCNRWRPDTARTLCAPLWRRSHPPTPGRRTKQNSRSGHNFCLQMVTNRRDDLRRRKSAEIESNWLQGNQLEFSRQCRENLVIGVSLHITKP
jgi:hypothetical protein